MTKDELYKKKEELMKSVWTEDLHDELGKMKPNDAKLIIESMSNSEIYSKVNIRRHQEDYIADYIEYLWEISKPTYWKHIIISLDPQVGTLWSDNMNHFDRMCSQKIPKEVLFAVLNFAIEIEENFKQDLETIGCVIKAQIDKFGRIDEIKEYILSLEEKKQEVASRRVFELAKQECVYGFG